MNEIPIISSMLSCLNECTLPSGISPFVLLSSFTFKSFKIKEIGQQPSSDQQHYKFRQTHLTPAVTILLIFTGNQPVWILTWNFPTSNQEYNLLFQSKKDLLWNAKHGKKWVEKNCPHFWVCEAFLVTIEWEWRKFIFLKKLHFWFLLRKLLKPQKTNEFERIINECLVEVPFKNSGLKLFFTIFVCETHFVWVKCSSKFEEIRHSFQHSNNLGLTVSRL